jgi:hypothetical protein
MLILLFQDFMWIEDLRSGKVSISASSAKEEWEC